MSKQCVGYLRLGYWSALACELREGHEGEHYHRDTDNPGVAYRWDRSGVVLWPNDTVTNTTWPA